MDLPSPLASASFSRHFKSVSHRIASEAERKMTQVASHVRNLALVKCSAPDKNDGENTISVAITIYSTWQKRGLSSRHDVLPAILVGNDQAVDYEVMLKHYYTCQNTHMRQRQQCIEIEKWLTIKTTTPVIMGMEGAEALTMFRRPIDERELKYT